jgi:uncharacterized lipoprotein YmbA
MLLSLISTLVLAGCSTAAPESRPYSAQEHFELSMEALSRQGLSYDQYVQARTRLVRGQDAAATGLVESTAPAGQVGRDG